MRVLGRVWGWVVAVADLVDEDVRFVELERELGGSDAMPGAYGDLAVAVLKQAVQLARGDDRPLKTMGPELRPVMLGPWRDDACRFLAGDPLALFWCDVAGLRLELFERAVGRVVA